MWVSFNWKILHSPLPPGTMNRSTMFVGTLEHPATLYPDFQADKIVSLHTCVLFTAVRLDSGSIYWWGVLPFAQRKKLLEKYTNKKKSNSKHQKKKPKPSNSASNPSNNEITVGSQVCMRKAPMYHAGKNIWLDIERDTVWTVNVWLYQFQVKHGIILA